MKEPTARHRGIRESIFASCTHGDSRIVRGVISTSRFSSAWIPSVGAGGIPTEAVRRSQTAGCICGVPSYLVDLDERLDTYMPANPIERRSSSDETLRVKTYVIAKIRSRLLPDLQL